MESTGKHSSDNNQLSGVTWIPAARAGPSIILLDSLWCSLIWKIPNLASLTQTKHSFGENTYSQCEEKVPEKCWMEVPTAPRAAAHTSHQSFVCHWRWHQVCQLTCCSGGALLRHWEASWRDVGSGRKEEKFHRGISESTVKVAFKIHFSFA